MDSTATVILVLQLLINLGPLAVYFLVLGLLNSQRRPQLVTSRTDFITLAVAFVPVLLAPVFFLTAHHSWPLLGLGALAGAFAFLALLPRQRSGWVIYHTTEAETLALLCQAVRRQGRKAEICRNRSVVIDGIATFRLSAFPWLGCVSIHVDPRADARFLDELEADMSRRLAERSLLPSPIGTCLVLIGLALGSVPVWMMFRHMDAIVDVVRDLLPA